MPKLKLLTPVLVLALYSLQPLEAQTDPAGQWPGYRGYLASGWLDNANLPETFNLNTMENILWKTEVPGLGLSSPVVWENKIFITTAVSKTDKTGFRPGIYGDIEPVDDSSVHDWKLLCYDKDSGRLLWERTCCSGIPIMKRHPKSTHANPTVSTDGSSVVAFFGSEGLYCYDMNGTLRWKKSFGPLKSVFFAAHEAQWEFASSPLIYNGVLVIQCDVLENSFLAAFDLKSGKELWKTDRDEYPGWCTPNIYSVNGKTYIAVNGFKNRGGYDFGNGREIWRMEGGGDIQIPTPVVGKDLLYFNSAHGPSSPVMAIDKSAAGDITLKDNTTSGPFIRWYLPRGGSYMHTMLLYRDHLYNVNWNGAVVCLDPLTGNEIFRGKLGNSDSFIASPVAADGRIYIVDENGTIYILADGRSFSLLHEIPLGDICMSVPAVTKGAIVFRTQKYLIAAGKKN